MLERSKQARKWRVGGSDGRKMRLLGLAIGLVLGMSACSQPDAQVQRTLNIYNWSDYIGDDTIANFEKETGIKVHYDTFDANETLHAKLVAGHSGYDIVVPSTNWAAAQIAGGLLQKIDHRRIASYGNIDPFLLQTSAKVDPGNQYLVPWLWGIATVGINVDRVKAALGDLPMPDNAWDLIFKPAYAQRLQSCGISLLDSGDEVFPTALHYLGLPAYSKSPADYAAASKLLSTIRPYVGLFSSSGYINELADGSICVALGWNGDLASAATRAKEANNGEHVEVLLPPTGGVMFIDMMAIPADAKHLDEIYAWMSYIYRPDVQAAIVNKVRYANPVRAADALIHPEILANKSVFIPSEQRSKLISTEPIDNDTRRMRTRLYTRFKAGI